MNINTIVNEQFHGKSFKELVDCPLTALCGIGPNQAKALEDAFGVTTIGQLAGLKVVAHAVAIEMMAGVETQPQGDAAKETLLDEAVEMTFPASDPIWSTPASPASKSPRTRSTPAATTRARLQWRRTTSRPSGNRASVRRTRSRAAPDRSVTPFQATAPWGPHRADPKAPLLFVRWTRSRPRVPRTRRWHDNCRVDGFPVHAFDAR